MRQLRSKGWPGFRFNISTHGTEIIIRIRTNKFHRIVEVFSLESRICSKFSIELQETGIHVGVHRLIIDRSHHPLTIDAIEKELLHCFLGIEHLFYNHMVDSSILHQIHLLLIIQNQGVIILMHEEMLHFPSPFSYRFYEFIIVIDRQWEMNTFHLQFSIRSKIKDEIIEKLICSLRHRSLLDQFFRRINSLSICDNRINRCRIMHLSRLLVRASNRRKTNDCKDRQ